MTQDGRLRRKRRCPACGTRFATLEVLDGLLVQRPPQEPKPAKPKRTRRARKLESGPAKPKIQKNQKPQRYDDDSVVDFDDADIRSEITEIARELGAFDGRDF